MKDKTYVGQPLNRVYVAVEDPSSGVGSYQLVLLSFGLIVALRTLTMVLVRFLNRDPEQHHASDYFTRPVDFMVSIGSHVATLTLSLFSFAVAFVHFREMKSKNK